MRGSSCIYKGSRRCELCYTRNLCTYCIRSTEIGVSSVQTYSLSPFHTELYTHVTVCMYVCLSVSMYVCARTHNRHVKLGHPNWPNACWQHLQPRLPRPETRVQRPKGRKACGWELRGLRSIKLGDICIYLYGHIYGSGLDFRVLA